jgi:hypothetical protein
MTGRALEFVVLLFVIPFVALVPFFIARSVGSSIRDRDVRDEAQSGVTAGVTDGPLPVRRVWAWNIGFIVGVVSLAILGSILLSLRR